MIFYANLSLECCHPLTQDTLTQWTLLSCQSDGINICYLQLEHFITFLTVFVTLLRNASMCIHSDENVSIVLPNVSVERTLQRQILRHFNILQPKTCQLASSLLHTPVSPMSCILWWFVYLFYLLCFAATLHTVGYIIIRCRPMY